MKLDSFYYFEYSDYWPHLYCYIHNVPADKSFSLLRIKKKLSLCKILLDMIEKSILRVNWNISFINTENLLSIIWLGHMVQ